jgi:hypothetical protein
MDTFIKTRRFKIRTFQDGDAAETIRAGLLNLQGMRRVEVRPPDHLLVEYDLMRVKLRDIDVALERLGHPIAQGLLRRIWKSWIGFTEDNTVDNLRAPVAPCCANPELTKGTECKLCATPVHHGSNR